MKILVIQLARFGDIYLTWPTLNALKRVYPSAELHLLVREKFAEATSGLCGIKFIHKWSTQKILTPLFEEGMHENEALIEIEKFLYPLKDEGFDRIINLSFSPLSSYITHYLANHETKVQGYTRHADGFLAIPDDASAYFYAQVGVGRSNRYHLGEIFASVAGVDLLSSDWQVDENLFSQDKKKNLLGNLHLPSEPYMVVHATASSPDKKYDTYKWRQTLLRLEREWSGHFLLMGSADEKEEIELILSGSGLQRSHNIAGQTKLLDLFALIHGAELLLANDSVALHIASLCKIPVVNLSFSSVNFWETGPRTVGSRVLWASTPETLPSDRVSDHVMGLLQGREGQLPYVERLVEGLIAYQLHGYNPPEFEWKLIQALYTGEAWPEIKEGSVADALLRLRDIVHLALDSIDRTLIKSERARASGILQQVDEIIQLIEKLVPEVRPLINWFQTERLRIGPDDLAVVIKKTREIFIKLDLILACYFGRDGMHSLTGGWHGSPEMER